MTKVQPVIQVIGVGLAGASSLAEPELAKVKAATLLIGSQRLVEAIKETVFGDARQTFSATKTSSTEQPSSAEKTSSGDIANALPEIWVLKNFTQTFDELRSRLAAEPTTQAVILATGDPLFFGIGRLLLSAFPPQQLAFYPQVSAIQLAFSRLKLPWQDATLVSVHGRDESRLTQALKKGDAKIAVLTDAVLTPQAIANMIRALELPIRYQLWVCESLGSATDERIACHDPLHMSEQAFASLNVVVLLRESETSAEEPSTPNINTLPLIGLPDSVFKGYADRPTLMTKREIRLLILGAIAPLNHQVIWDIGAGTGAVSVELSRLCPQAEIYAIEKTAMGAALVEHNAERLAIAPIHSIQGRALQAIASLPKPDRVFIGGSSGQLIDIMTKLHELKVSRIVVALATLEHLSELTLWLTQPHIVNHWQSQLTQVNISRSLPVGPLTRFSPLNPVTLVTLSPSNISHPQL